MQMTNIHYLPGHRIVEHYGLVQGSTIRAKHLGRDIAASLKNLVGGELKGYTELLSEARAEATRRMVEQARQLGANAVINVRYATSSVAQGAAELFAYGTAVKTEPERPA
jgi:uncharacterized protein YbjQ (UPF0145 family)